MRNIHLYVSGICLILSDKHILLIQTFGDIHFLSMEQPSLEQEGEKSHLLTSVSGRFIFPSHFAAEEIHSAILSSRILLLYAS